MSLLTTHDITVLIQQTPNTLADWYCQLNEWEWPPEIQNPEPPIYRPCSRRGEIMLWIVRDIGRKECLRQHWKRHDIETPGNKFDDWYKMNFPDRTDDVAA